MIAILPAAGDASRMKGLPKFLLPILDQNKSLLDYHIEKLIATKKISRIFIVTQPQSIGFFTQWLDKREITLIVKKTDSMESSIFEVTKLFDENQSFLLIMPDTYFSNENAHNIITEINSEIDLTFVLWKFSQLLIGKVGQIKLDSNFNVLDIKDKDISCNYEYMWGSLIFKGKIFNRQPKLSYISELANSMVANKVVVKGSLVSGDYLDCGTPQGLRRLLAEFS